MSWNYSCKETGKRRYSRAIEAAQASIKMSKRKCRKQRTYRCDACGGWHVTHIMHETRPNNWHQTHRKQG